jgi:V/A-type H+-transporting ATPase subunit I
MIERMQKLLLAGKKALLPEVLAFVQGENAFQVERQQEDGFLPYSEPHYASQAAGPLEHELGQIDSILALLPRLKDPPLASPAPLPPLEELQRDIVSWRNQLTEKEEEKKYLATYQEALDVLLPLLLSLEGSPRLEALGFLSTSRERVNVAKLRDELDQELPNRYQWISRPVGENLQAEVLAYPKTEVAMVRSSLGQHGFSELRLPRSVGTTPGISAVQQLQRRLAELPGEISTLAEKLAQASRDRRHSLLLRRGLLLDQIEREKAQQAAMGSHFAFLLSGWVPCARLPSFRSKLERRFGRQVAVEPLELDEHDMRKAPILLKNKALFQPFELLLSAFRPPRYDRIDPTPIIGFFFPLFFGLIIGDIGYGLLFLLPLLYLFFRSKPGTWRSVALIGILCASWTIVFGILFGEFFGTLGEAFGIHPLLINRESQNGILTFLVLSLMIGAIQIFLGFGLEIYMSLRERAYRDAVEAGSLMSWTTGLILAVIAGVGIVPTAFLYIGLGLIGTGWVGVIIIKGPITGITEPLSTTGNILSYSRLMGIGVSSVYLAFAANQIGGLMGNPVVGFIVGAVCHLLFLILGIISPIIQSARLHFVEFFTKFKYHEYPGNPYKPLARAIQKGV